MSCRDYPHAVDLMAHRPTREAQLPGATFVQVANGLHVSALDALDLCATRIVRSFNRAASVRDAGCAAATTPPIHAAPPFWRTEADRRGPG